MTRIGVVGSPWRADVTGWGRVDPLDGSPPLDWFIGADDRWRIPQSEPTTRQTRLRSTPVLETRTRVPGGDAVHRVYAVAHDGGHTVVEVANESPLPFAVAFTRPDLCAPVAASPVVPTGIELAPGSVLYPVAHRVALRVTIAHTARSSWPGALPSAEQVARGWRSQCERGTRYELPDPEIDGAMTEARCAVVLDGPLVFADPVDRLLAAGEWVRLGEPAGPLVQAVALDASRVARCLRRTSSSGVASRWSLRSAMDVLESAGEQRAAADVRVLLDGLVAGGLGPDDDRDDTAALSVLGRVRSMVAETAADAIVLAPRPPRSWIGQNLSVYGELLGRHRVSFAVRWHGERPALLWELAGHGPVRVRCGLDPCWSSRERRGETLLSGAS